MLADQGHMKKNQVTNIQTLVAAYQFGQETRNVSTCKWLFPCDQVKTEAEIAIDETGSAAVDEEVTSARIKCANTAQLCPGYSISCALCGLFLPNTCVVVCPVAGIYCGNYFH